MGEVGDKLAAYSSSPAELRAYLGNLHIFKSDQSDLKKYYKLLTDFDFIAAKVNHPEFGVQALIDDYDLIDDSEVLNNPEYKPQKIKVLTLIQGALRLSAHVLAENKAQLAAQLWGRMQSFEMDEIQALLEQAKQSKITWLRPLTPSLTRPDGRLLRTLTGHSDSVNAVAVTPDGKHLISGSSDKTIKVWDLATGKKLFTLTGHEGSVNAVAVTHDNKKVISASDDKTLKVWNLETGTELFPLIGHSASVNAFAVTPDGKRVISGSMYTEVIFAEDRDGNDRGLEFTQGALIFWNLETGKTELIFTFAQSSVNVVAVTPDERRVIFSVSVHTNDKNIYVRDLKLKTISLVPEDPSEEFNNLELKTISLVPEDPSKEFSLIGHKNLINAVAVTPDNKKVISASDDKTIKVWNLKTGRELFTLIGHSASVKAVAVTFDGKYLFSASSDKTLKVWNFETETDETEILPLSAHRDSVNAITVTADSNYVISASSDKTLKVWNLKSGKRLYTLTSQNVVTHKYLFFKDDNLFSNIDAFITDGASLTALTVISNSKRVISGAKNGYLEVWDLEHRKVFFFLKSWVSFLYDFLVRRFAQVYLLLVIVLPLLSIMCIFLGKIIIFIFNLLILYILISVKTFQLFLILKKLIYQDYRTAVAAVAVTSDQKIFSASANTIKVWKIEKRKKLLTLKGHKNLVNAVAVTPDSKWAISGSKNGDIIIWNLKTGKKKRTLIRHSASVNAVAVSPDGNYLISGSSDKTINVWNLKTEKYIFTIKGHRDSVNAVAVTPDGKNLISTSSDHSLKVWNFESRQVIASFSGESALCCCAVAPDGVTIVAGDKSGQVYFLRLEGMEA